MADLHTYQFPARTGGGVLFGLSAARLAAVAVAGMVFVTSMLHPTPTSAAAGAGLIAVLLATVSVRVAGRPVIDWLPIWVGYGWRMATRNNEFYASPDLEPAGGLPDETVDLPGELFGIEIHDHRALVTSASLANPTPAGYGIIRDTFRRRAVAIAEVSGGDFLFGDPDDQQARICAWGRLLDHLAQSLPDVTRLQVVHTAGPATADTVAGPDPTARADPDVSYQQAVGSAAGVAQEHRLLLAIGLDLNAARQAIRQAGRGSDGAAQVLMDRAATLEDALEGAGIRVHGWLPARAIGQILWTAFDPSSHPDVGGDVNDGGGVSPAAAGPTGMVEGWSAVRHDTGWSTTLRVVGPPSRPVTGDFLQHLLIGVPARRRLSILYVPTPLATAERRAQTQQVSSESEQTLRARWGFGTSARQRRHYQDATQREEDLIAGRTVYRIVWLITVTAATPTDLDRSVGQVEAAARRCGLELRRLAGTQRQAIGYTLPLCRGAR